VWFGLYTLSIQSCRLCVVYGIQEQGGVGGGGVGGGGGEVYCANIVVQYKVV